MMGNLYNRGSFTLPGEAGYENLTLKLAEKWGADVIRDSDGTVLSDSILSAGYDIYSTICLVRADNAWAKENMDKLQQNYLMSFPVIAEGTSVKIDLLKGYFREQFVINSKDDPKEWWQVFDRTSGEEVACDRWSFDPGEGTVIISNTTPWHKYTVNFLVCRIWEEISMYNHITNNWGDREHLMAVEPRYPETQEHILEFLEKWLIDHPHTNVVRFTSMFYNFCWFWGDDPKLRFIYSDWASYDFTVNPFAMKEFEKVRGYRPTSEDFVNKGLYNSSHNPPSERYLDWMDFVNSFVVDFGKKCIDLVHKYGKKAYVFYDDHWIGIEPYGERFKDFGFDGIIKCVFNAFEARLCSGVGGVRTHELRLHPYLFPTGLRGEPTFKEGGNPTQDAVRFWANVRRALLRAPIDRIGLGGYLHLVEPFPDFTDYIENLANEFRRLKALHEGGKPYTPTFKVTVLTAWGKLRSWSCSGHMHEHPELELIHVLESLAGLPFDVEFLSFEDIMNTGIPGDVKVIINAGRAGSAWSGGENWGAAGVVEKLTGWAANGGGIIGIGEPSALNRGSQYFQLCDVLGVDREIGLTICKMKYEFEKNKRRHFICGDIPGEIDTGYEDVDLGNEADRIYPVSRDADVLADKDGSIRIAANKFRKGRAVYLAGYRFSPQNTRLLLRAVFWAAGREDSYPVWNCSNVETECAYYPGNKKLAVVNNSDKNQETTVTGAEGYRTSLTLAPYEARILDVR